MPGSEVSGGAGTTITFASGFFAQIIEIIEIQGIAREFFETTHSTTAAPSSGKFANMTYLPDAFADPGGITITVNFNPDTIPPINSAAETVTITFPLQSGDTSAANWAVTGFMTSFDVSIPVKTGKMTATTNIKFSGEITRTAAA